MLLTQTIAQRVSENLRLIASADGSYDNALEAFATAIDVKHVNFVAISLRVGRYAAAIGEAMGMEPGEVAALRSARYLHDIGKVAVDRRLFGKAGALDPEEFREMANHTVVGHQIVSSVQFPWPRFLRLSAGITNAERSRLSDKLFQDDLPMPVRIIALAPFLRRNDQSRPYRAPLSVGSALSDDAGPHRLLKSMIRMSFKNCHSSAPRRGREQPNALARYHVHEHQRPPISIISPPLYNTRFRARNCT